MYETHWQLTQKPFENGWDARFYYPSEVHQGALLKLRYAVENRRGAVVLSGPAGLGKSLLVDALRRQLPEQISPIARIVFPQLPADQLLALIADELETTTTPGAAPTLQHSVRRIGTALTENAKAGRHALLVVDEAHLISKGETLEAIRTLLNFDLDGQATLTVLLVGQPGLLVRLDRMPGFEQRVGVKCLLRPFTLEETVSYITHRLTAAGAQQTIFEQEALEAAHHLAHGLPRAINRLCDLALLIAFAEERPTISAALVESVSNELVTVAPE